MIKIITVGSIKEKFYKEAILEYEKRLRKYINVIIIEVKDEGLVEEEKAKNLEAQKIKKNLSEKDYIITLEIEGEEISSSNLATKLNNLLIKNSNLTFIIGGSYGLSSEIKNMANYHLSFSKMTFPHQLFRVILLEQLYRSFKIINNEKYHK